jgi:two-component system NtrC family sensor kinase
MSANDNDNGQDLQAKRILFIDDDEELLSSFSDLLTAKGFDMTTAADGDKGLEALRKDTFDVILCDLMMPNMTGDQLYAAIETEMPDQCKKFIFITGYEKEPKLSSFLSNPDVTVLTKPVTSGQLTEAIGKIG